MSDTKQNAAAASPTRLVVRELFCVSAQFWLTRRNVHRQVIALGCPQRDKTLTQRVRGLAILERTRRRSISFVRPHSYVNRLAPITNRVTAPTKIIADFWKSAMISHAVF